jgi:predicted Zn-dependent protease
MNRQNTLFAIRFGAIAAIAILLAGCGSAEYRARQAFRDYQAAAAAGDLRAARVALLHLVTARDDVPEYWEDLGKVQLELGAFSDAYYAYTRAHELDRSNITILGTLAQLALLSGNLDIAEEKARQLELVAPEHPAVNLTYAYLALRRSDLDEAERRTDQLLRVDPYNSSAKQLKSRILLKRGEPKAAVALLDEQVRVNPRDVGSLKALALLQEDQGNWPGVAATASQMAQLNRKDRGAALLFIEANFQANNIAAALRASQSLLTSASPGDLVDAVLSLWAAHWRGEASIEEARRLVRSANPEQRLAYASFFNRAGSPEDAALLLGSAPQLPVDRANSSANAIFADSLALRGRVADAKRLFDAVLAQEPDHVYALRGRTRLQLQIKAYLPAIHDAQRLVSVRPQSASDRLLLAQAYAAAGDRRQLDRTLWDAFHEIPADKHLFAALRAHVGKAGDADAVNRVGQEFQQQRDVALARELF